MYVVDSGNDRVVYLPPTAISPSDQATVGLDGLIYPTGMTVDTTGDVYAANFSNGYVLELPHGQTNTTLSPFGQLRQRAGMGSDSLGDVFATELDDGTARCWRSCRTRPCR